MDKTLLDTLNKAGISPTPKRPDGLGITVKEYMAEANCTEGVARKTLDEAEAAGVLTSCLMRAGAGQHSLVYFRPGEG